MHMLVASNLQLGFLSPHPLSLDRNRLRLSR